MTTSVTPLTYFKHFLSHHHIPYSYDLWIDFGDWYYDSHSTYQVSDLSTIDLWFSLHQHTLIDKAKQDHLKTWLSVCIHQTF